MSELLSISRLSCFVGYSTTPTPRPSPFGLGCLRFASAVLGFDPLSPKDRDVQLEGAYQLGEFLEVLKGL